MYARWGPKKVVLILGEYAMYDRMCKSKIGKKIIESVYEPIISNNHEKVWDELDDLSRDYYASDRANVHNRLIELSENQTEGNLAENTVWLGRIAEFCQSKGIDLYVVIPPFSPEYECQINPLMKDMLLNELDQMPYPVHYFNMNDST